MSSNSASATMPSSALPIDEGRNRLPMRDEMDSLRVLTFESKLKRGVIGNVDDGPKVGELPPISKDLR